MKPAAWPLRGRARSRGRAGRAGSHTLRAVLGAAAASGLLLLLCSPAQAADEVNIDHVEVADDGTVSVLLGVDHLPGGGAAPDLANLEVTLDGEPVESTAETVQAGDIQRTTVLALDTSQSMAGAPIKDAKAAALAFLDSAPPDVQVGLVTFSGTVHEVIAPSTDHAAVAEVIDGLKLTRGTHVHDAVVQSVGLAGDTGARSVLLLTDGKDEGGGSSLEDAVTAAEDGDVVVDVVALDQTPRTDPCSARSRTPAAATSSRPPTPPPSSPCSPRRRTPSPARYWSASTSPSGLLRKPTWPSPSPPTARRTATPPSCHSPR